MSFLGPSDDDIFRDPPVGVLGGKYGLTKIDSVTLGLPSPFTTLKLDSGLKIGSSEHGLYEDTATGILFLDLKTPGKYFRVYDWKGALIYDVGTGNWSSYVDYNIKAGKSIKIYRPDSSAYHHIYNDAIGNLHVVNEGGNTRIMLESLSTSIWIYGNLLAGTSGLLGTTSYRWSRGYINTFYHKVTEKSSNFSVEDGDGDYLVDASSGPVTATLPSAPDDGMIVPIQKVDSSSNAVTISCSGTDTFWDGTTSITLVTQWQYVILEYHSGKWYLWDPAAVYSGAHKLFYNSGNTEYGEIYRDDNYLYVSAGTGALGIKVDSDLYGPNDDVELVANHNVIARLGDAAGSYAFKVQDNTPSDIFSIDSSGAITIHGNITPDADNTIDLGSDDWNTSHRRFKDLYLAGNVYFDGSGGSATTYIGDYMIKLPEMSSSAAITLGTTASTLSDWFMKINYTGTNIVIGDNTFGFIFDGLENILEGYGRYVLLGVDDWPSGRHVLVDGNNRGSVSARIEEGAYHYVDDFDDGMGKKEWSTLSGATGSDAAMSSMPNGWIELTTGATANNYYGFDWGGYYTFRYLYRPTIEVRLKLSQTSNTRVRIGFIGSAANEYLYFEFDSSADTDWHLKCDNESGAPEDIDTAVAASTDEVVLRFEFKDDTTVAGFINGAPIVSDLFNKVPSGWLQPYVYIETLENAAKSMGVDYFKIWQDRT